MEPSQDSFYMPQADAPQYARLCLCIKSPTMTRFLFCTEGCTGLVTIYRKSQVLVERKINQGVPLVFIIYEMITGLVSCTWANDWTLLQGFPKKSCSQNFECCVGTPDFLAKLAKRGSKWPKKALLGPNGPRYITYIDEVVQKPSFPTSPSKVIFSWDNLVMIRLPDAWLVSAHISLRALLRTIDQLKIAKVKLIYKGKFCNNDKWYLWRT